MFNLSPHKKNGQKNTLKQKLHNKTSVIKKGQDPKVRCFDKVKSKYKINLKNIEYKNVKLQDVSYNKCISLNIQILIAPYKLAKYNF